MAAILRASSYFGAALASTSSKSESRKALHLFLMALVRKRRASDISVPLSCGVNSSSSLRMRSKWLLPFFGGINFSNFVLKKSAPTLSLLMDAEKESTAAISAMSSLLVLIVVPNIPDELTSTISTTVISLSSSKTFT